MKSNGDVKIELRTEADGEVHVEVPWAEPYGRDNHFKLLNLPFYAYGVSWGDIIETTPCPESGRPIFVRVVEKSGHQLVRVVFDLPVDEAPENQAHPDALVGLGCSYTGAPPSYICIDIPPEITLSDVVLGTWFLPKGLLRTLRDVAADFCRCDETTIRTVGCGFDFPTCAQPPTFHVEKIPRTPIIRS